MSLNDELGRGRRSRAVPRWLVLVAAVETASLAVLVVNALTADFHPLAAALGPVHGTLYLAIIILVATRRAGWRTVLIAAVPAFGGLLAVRRLRDPVRAAR